MFRLLILNVLIFLSACASLRNDEAHRDIANDSNVVKFDESLFQFKESNISDKTRNYPLLIENYFSGYRQGALLNVEFKEDSALADGVAYKLAMSAEKNMRRMVVSYSKNASMDTGASYEIFNLLRLFCGDLGEYSGTRLGYFELYYNIINNDIIAAQNWIKIRNLSLDAVWYSSFPASEFPEFAKENFEIFIQNRKKELEKDTQNYQKRVAIELQNQTKKDFLRKSVIESLDNLPQNLQLKNVIAKNDRKGAADLVRKYLPWEQMAPFETRYWENFLEVVEHPAPIEKRIFIYRGNDDEAIYSAYKNGIEIEKKIAKMDGDVFIMSTMLSSNQGSWNRRLRSLTAMNKKFIATIRNGDQKLDNEFTKSSRIMTMFKNHSIDPMGSPFISFTPYFDIASSFGKKQISAYAIDPRLLKYNITSSMPEEAEFLTPLFVFPEDLVAYYDSEIDSTLEKTEETMKALFKKRLVRNHSESEANDIFTQVMLNSKKYYDTSIENIHFETDFFTKMTKDLPTLSSKIKPEDLGLINEHETCLDLLSLFFKK